MSTKRPAHPPATPSLEPKVRVSGRRLPAPESDDGDDAKEILRLLRSKIMGSHVLNGGFDTLMIKIEGMERSQDHLVTRVDAIHEAVYHPDTGLFSRLKSVEEWRNVENKAVEEETKTNARQEEMVRAHDTQIQDLVKFKAKLASVGKWFAGTAGAGALGLIAKLIYDFIVHHVKYV